MPPPPRLERSAKAGGAVTPLGPGSLPHGDGRPSAQGGPYQVHDPGTWALAVRGGRGAGNPVSPHPSQGRALTWPVFMPPTPPDPTDDISEAHSRAPRTGRAPRSGSAATPTTPAGRLAGPPAPGLSSATTVPLRQVTFTPSPGALGQGAHKRHPPLPQDENRCDPRGTVRSGAQGLSCTLGHPAHLLLLLNLLPFSTHLAQSWKGPGAWPVAASSSSWELQWPLGGRGCPKAPLVSCRGHGPSDPWPHGLCPAGPQEPGL